MLFLIMIILIILSFLVVFSKNTITSMLCLILSFIFTGICFLLLGAEFIAFILIIVYASAISILFIFIIMLLNLRLIDIYYINFYYIPLCIFISIFLLLISYLFLIENYSFFYYNDLILNNDVSFIWLKYLNIINYKSNLYYFGIALYNYYYIFVIISGLVLFLAMVGSILIVLNTDKVSIKKHDNTKRKCILKNYEYHYNIRNINNKDNINI